MSDNRPSNELLQRLRQWADKSWVQHLGIGDILHESNRLADDCGLAAAEIERLQAELAKVQREYTDYWQWAQDQIERPADEPSESRARTDEDWCQWVTAHFPYVSLDTARVMIRQYKPTICTDECGDCDLYCHCFKPVESMDSDLVCGNCGKPFHEARITTQPPCADEVKHYEQRLRDLMRYTSHNPSCEYINKRQTRCSCGYAALAAIIFAEVGPPSSVSTKSAESP